MAKEISVGINVGTRSSGIDEVVVRRGRVESVDLFEIKDSELELFEKGSPTDLQLNFSIFLLSTAISAICSIATAEFKNPKVENAFYVVAFCGTVIGIFLFISWWQNRTSLKDVCVKIRARITQDCEPSQTEPSSSQQPQITSPDVPSPPQG